MRNIRLVTVSLFCVLLLLPDIALAIGSTSFNLDTALANITNVYGKIVQLIIAITYIIGLTLIIRGIMMYRIFANQTMGSAARGEIAGPMVHLVIGAILLYFPSTLDASLSTVFGTANLSGVSDMISYSSLSGSEKWLALSQLAIKYLRLVGLIAFVRGWVILSKMGHSGSQPGSMGKGLMHIIGGILLINGVETFNILATTMGYTGT